MTFDEWYNDMQHRYSACYDGYEDLLREAFNAGAESALTWVNDNVGMITDDARGDLVRYHNPIKYLDDIVSNQ